MIKRISHPNFVPSQRRLDGPNGTGPKPERVVPAIHRPPASADGNGSFMRIILIAFCLVNLISLPSLQAAPLPADAAVFREPCGPRSQAMGGAHRGLGANNDTLYLNPAGMAAIQRYAVEFNYGYDLAAKLSAFQVSAVDSKSGPVAGGLGYTHLRSDSNQTDTRLHRVVFGLSMPVTSFLTFGLSGRHIRGNFKDDAQDRKVALYTGDVGVLASPSGNFSLGFSAHNIIKTDLNRMTPLLFGTGAAFATGILTLTTDLVFSPKEKPSHLHSIHLGAEVFAAQSFPLRVGYLRRPWFDVAGKSAMENVLTFGLALVSQTGGFAVAVERSLERVKRWQLVGSLQIFM